MISFPHSDTDTEMETRDMDTTFDVGKKARQKIISRASTRWNKRAYRRDLIITLSVVIFTAAIFIGGALRGMCG